MITDSEVLVEAPAPLVWDVYSDVTRWPDWTEAFTRVEALDEADLAVGRRYRVDQPRFPRLVWEVTEVEPRRSWTWRQHAPAATTLATHELVPQGEHRTLVRQRIDQRGAIGVVVGVLTRRLTKRYLALEAQGLKARVEHG